MVSGLATRIKRPLEKKGIATNSEQRGRDRDALGPV